MKTSSLAALALASSLLTTAGIAAAQPAAFAPGPAPAATVAAQTSVETRHHSINVSPLGLIGGGFNANYEYLSGRHGVIVELGTSDWTSEYTSTVNGQVVEQEETSGRHATLGVGYRLHFGGRQAGWFLGAMLHHNVGTAKIHNVDNGREVNEADIAYQSTTVTANVGRRFMLTRNLNLTARLGVGGAERKVTDDDASATAVAELNDTLDFPLAVDGELSLGWSF